MVLYWLPSYYAPCINTIPYSLQQLIRSGEQENITVTQALINTVWPAYEAFVGTASGLSTGQLKQHNTTLTIYSRLLENIKKLPVLKIKIFDLQGKTIFSTDKSQIGIQKPSSYAGRQSAASGEVISTFSFRRTFNAIQGTLTDRHVVSSYLPIYGKAGTKVSAVFEVYYDVTNRFQQIRQDQFNVFLIIIATMSIFYFVLFFIFKRANVLLRRQALNLNEYLSQIEGQNIKLEERTFALNSAIKELETHRSHLQDNVEERTKELNHAKNTAERASNSKSLFLANMSHELRTPLNAILGYVEMLYEDMDEEDKTGSDMAKIHTAGAQLLHVINDILDISKIESGKMDIYLEQINIKEIITEVCESTNSLAIKNHSTIEIECHDELGEFTTDTTKLRQILYNLLSNANKFTAKGKVKVSATRTFDKVKDCLKIQVSDTGIGMTKEEMLHIFKSFSQADESTTRRFGGTGLGLAICNGLCRMLGGTVSVDSEVDVGTVFTVRLPIKLKNGPQQDNSEVLKIGPKIDPALVRLGPKRRGTKQRRRKISTVLSVDDDAEVRDLMERFLTRNGFYAYTAASAEEGEQIAEEIHPDIILTDIMMPEKDGISFIKSIKKVPELAETPVIVVTIAGEREICMSLGVSAYMNKPVDWNLLLDIIVQTIRKQESLKQQASG